MRSPIISAHAEHRPEHYRFQRQHMGELTRSPAPIWPILPWIKDIAAGVAMVAFMIAGFTLMGAIADMVTR